MKKLKQLSIILILALTLALGGCASSSVPWLQSWSAFQTRVGQIDWAGKAEWFVNQAPKLDFLLAEAEKFKPSWTPELETGRALLNSAKVTAAAFADTAAAYKSGQVTEALVDQKASAANQAYLNAYKAITDIQAKAPSVPTP